MKKLALALTLLGVAGSAVATSTVSDVYQQSYALYVLNHPDNQAQSSKVLIQNYQNDYADLFGSEKKVSKAQYVRYEHARLAPLMQQRREMSLKQTHVRYGILDKNQDQKLTLKEFQDTGLKSFDEWDKNKDGVVNAADAVLTDKNAGTHDGFRVKLPISMPMPSNVTEFIQHYGQGKNQVTLGDYLTARDQQYFATDANHDGIVTEQEYTDEFMQRFDNNTAQGTVKMQDFAGQQFDAIAQGKTTIQASDIKKFAQKIDQSITQ